MRKIFLSLVIITLLCINGVQAQFNGSGTSSDPYLISNEQDLYNLTTAVNRGNTFSGKFFKQTADIDFVDSQVFPNGFAPIGSYDRLCPFSGTYDGDGHSIIKLNILGQVSAAFFGYIDNACIKNLNFENVNITDCEAYCSVLAAIAQYSTISNITASGQLSVSGRVESVSLSGIVGCTTGRCTISECVSMLTFDVSDANDNIGIMIYGIVQVSGIPSVTISNCLVSTFIKGVPSFYFPISDDGATVSNCLVVESNGVQSEIQPTYSNCYFDHQNTNLAEFPVQQTYIDGFYAKTTSAMTSGSLFNDENWVETPGIYPRPAAVANTNIALLAASPVTFGSADCITSVASNFTVSTANNVVWATESDFLRISGDNVSIVNAVDSLVEIYAFRNGNVKNIQIRLSDDALGSKGNPYRISSEADFLELASLLSSEGTSPVGNNFDFDPQFDGELYFLVDSDFTITSLRPIGLELPFKWHFDGGNHTITVEQIEEYYNLAGLFAIIEGATISNIVVSYNNVSTEDAFNWGGIAGYAESSIISNCKVMGYLENRFSPESSGFFGGIVANANGTMLYNCVNLADLYLYSGQVGITTGGIVGQGESVTMRSCANLGYIHGYPDQGEVGGLIGSASSSTIIGCANYADVETLDYDPGAFVGMAENSSFTDCVNYSNVLLPFAGASSSTNFANNINVSGNVSTLEYNIDFESLIALNKTEGDYGTSNNNYTDKQLVPIKGNSSAINCVLTSDLTSGNVDLDPNKWVFINGRYPMPVGTDIDNDLVKLATTPIFLSASDNENYETVKSVCSSFVLPSDNNISWMRDSVAIPGSTLNIETIRQDSTAVSLLLSSHIGDLNRNYGIVIPARVGSPENPLLIESLSDFNELAEALEWSTSTYKGVTFTNGGSGLTFKLTTDIASNNTTRITPISSFSGNFNGGGHTITISSRDILSYTSCGLFASISFAKIDSLNVVVNGNINASNISSDTESYTSVLCAQASNSTISNCTVTIDGQFVGRNSALVCGLLENSELRNCSTLGSGSLLLGGDYLAGVVNKVKNSKISACTNNVDIGSTSCYYAAAGIVGLGSSLILENCVNNADIIINEEVFAAGIVGRIEGRVSANVIRTSVNNGYIYANNATGGKACGILGEHSIYNINSGLLRIENCVNAGRISGLTCAAGIAESINGSISNCANYGNLESEKAVTGIVKEQSHCTTTGNIAAYRPSYGYDKFDTYKQEVMSTEADEDDFFDEQITEIKVDSLRLGFYDHGTPRTTQLMVGNALANDLPGDWDFTDELYPLPAGIDPNDPRNKLARLPIILNSDGVGRSERITAVISDIILPQVDGVTWESSDPNVVLVPSGGGVATVINSDQREEVTITATCEDYSRSYQIVVHEAQGTTADNPYVLSTCSDILSRLCKNDVHPAGGYNLYFRIGNPIEITRNSLAEDADGNFNIQLENLNVLFPSSYPFRGHLDGDGNTITWSGSGYEGNYYGLFKYTDGAEISNLTMYYNENDSYNTSGTLIGNAKATTIRNCIVYSNLKATDRVGGIVDVSSDGTVISNCAFVGELSAKNIGGIVAEANDTRIDNSISMLRNYEEGETLEKAGAIVLSGGNVTVDSCLVIGDNSTGIMRTVYASFRDVSINNCYYDKQVWIPELGDSIYNTIIGMTTRELTGNGLFNWSHTEGKYPVPAGIESMDPITLIKTPMLIGENDADVMHVTSLGISDDDSVQWDANSTYAISGYNVNCVDEPASAEIVATYVSGRNSYSFTRTVEVVKGILEASDYSSENIVCEGEDIILRNPFTGDATYQWSADPEMDIDEIGIDSVAVKVPSDFMSGRSVEDASISIMITASFEGCEDKTHIFEYVVKPSPSHFIVNDTAVCTGNDLIVNCKLDEGYEEYADSFFLSWYDASDMNTSLLGDSVSAMGYYIPILTEDRNLRIVARSIEGGCIDTLDVALSVNPANPITVVSGEPDQQICEGELMEPVVFSVQNATYTVPEGIYTEYNTANNQLTLSGRPFYNSQYDYSYTIYGCGSSLSGAIDVSKRTRIFTDDSFSQVINLGDNLDRIRMEDTGGEYYITVESLDGTETFIAEEFGLYINNIDGIDFLSGTPQMPGEYIYHITIPEKGACPAIVYDNFLGIYDTEELAATALDATLCEGETATLATVERPGAYGGEYVWTLEEDTVGTGSRINVIPPVGTSTYEVACGGKRMYGEYEIGDYLIPGEAFGETGYSMLKNTEITMYDYQTGYMIANVEQDSLLLMSLSKIEEVEWSQAPEMLAADDDDMYLPSSDELGNILSNYDKFYFALEYDLPVMLSSTEKDANTVYVLNVNYARMMEYPKDEPATAMGFKKIAKSEVINMVGRTSNISRTASVNVIVKERQDMTISTDDVLCNTDTARVGINTGYEVLNWYNVTNPEAEIMYDEDLAVLTEGTYIAVGTYELGACYDTLEVKVKDLAFYIPQDTTVCDSAILTIAKEDVIVMIDGEAIEGQTLVLTETGTYTIALVGVGDTCREEKILNLTVNPSYSISFDTIVYDSTFVWNEETYTATGNYTQFFTTINGCDSIVTANVTFVNTETEFALFGIVTESDGTTPLADVEVSSEGTTVTTSNDGSYLIMIQRTNPVVHFSKPGYNIICDSVSGGGEYNVSMFKPEISVSLSDDSYETSPYVVRQVVVELSNTGDGPLAWSSVVESDFTASDRAVHPRSNSQMWEYADEVIVTNSNAEQAIATDGFYIYTASWRRAGEFNRYSPDNGYLETFVIDGVGGVRNLSYGNGLFFATDNTNKIYIINMDTQSLEDVITLNDPDLQIRYCTYSTEEDLLYIGNWTNLYKLVAYNTAYPTMIPLSYSMDNVYSIAYDAFSGSEPCLWAFSQVSENNGPFAKLYKLNKNGVQIAEMEHYINDASLATPSSLAGGICVSQNLYDDKYVLLANIQNSNARNNIAVYEIGGKSSWVSTNTKGGVIPAGESINVVVTELATENGNYSAVVKFKPNVYMPQNTELNLSLAVSSPACSSVENLVAETDTFHVVNLSWDAVDAGDYESVSYLVYEQGSNVAIDTVQTTSYSVENAEVGNHCYYVRAFMRGETDCVSNPSNTACAEILAFPCDVQLSLTARAFGDRIRLEWNELFGVDHYEVHVDDLTGVILYNGLETMFEDTLALPETDNCYEVVAYFRNEECGSKRSNTACARISADGCSELPVVTATAVGNSVVLSWGKIQGVQSYSLYKDDKYITSTSDTVFYDMMLEYETEYCYVVEINCGYGMFGLSDEVCVTTEKEYEEQNAIESITNESIDIYPNPAFDRFFVDGQQMQGIQIVNFAGQVVYELDNISEDRLMIDASAFAPGVYAVRIILSDSRSVVKRIVIGR